MCTAAATVCALDSCSILEGPYIQNPVSIRTPTMDGSSTSSNVCQYTERESNFNSTATTGLLQIYKRYSYSTSIIGNIIASQMALRASCWQDM